MNVSEMNEQQIRDRLAAVGNELCDAQADLSALLDSDGGKSADYVRLSFAVEKLQAEQARLCKALPFAIQTELDKAEQAADDLSTAAAAALKTAKTEMQAKLRKSGFAKTHETHLDEIVERADEIVFLRAEAGKASNAAHRAAMAAMQHRIELPKKD